MELKWKKAGDRIADVYVRFSDRELEKWGRAQGRCSEEIYSVDTIVKDGYCGYIRTGYTDSRNPGQKAVIYEIETVYEGGEKPWTAYYTVKATKDGEERTDLPEWKVYKFSTNYHKNLYNTTESFLKALIKDGFMAFPIEEETVDNKSIVENVIAELGYELGCWDEKINQLTTEELKKVTDNIEYACDTDVVLNGKEWVVQIDEVGGEIDLNVITKQEFISRYGDERYAG